MSHKLCLRLRSHDATAGATEEPGCSVQEAVHDAATELERPPKAVESVCTTDRTHSTYDVLARVGTGRRAPLTVRTKNHTTTKPTTWIVKAQVTRVRASRANRGMPPI
jgi:hypothetical protein